MLTAIRQSDSVKVFGFKIEKHPTDTYRCEYCHDLVLHHRSKSMVRIGHFKHKPNSYCPNVQIESVEHSLTKTHIHEYLVANYPNAFREIDLERWICNRRIRPDIYLETKKGNKIAIEVQASQLTVDEVIYRTTRYEQNGIYVLWVLVWNKSKISTSNYIERGCSHRTCNWDCDHTVKLTEMELLFSWMNFKKIVLWDYEMTHGDAGFHIIEVDKFQAEGTEFYSSGGEHQSFEGRIAKNKKIIRNVHFDIPFSEFVPSRYQKFKLSGKNYELPLRRQMTWKKR